jgi:UrcA family protein
MFNNNHRTLGRGIIAAASVVCILVTGGASAGGRELTVGIRASAEGLDLTRPAGVQAFYQRIKNAAYVACTRADQVGLAPVADVKDCVENSLGEAIRRAGNPALTAAYLETHSPRVASAHGIAVPTSLAAK